MHVAWPKIFKAIFFSYLGACHLQTWWAYKQAYSLLTSRRHERGSQAYTVALVLQEGSDYFNVHHQKLEHYFHVHDVHSLRHACQNSCVIILTFLVKRVLIVFDGADQ